MQSAWIRASASGVVPSKRSTSTGVVFEARTRPKPSSYSTRTPSIVTISRAPGKLRLGAQPRDDLGRLAFGAGDVQLGRR